MGTNYITTQLTDFVVGSLGFFWKGGMGDGGRWVGVGVWGGFTSVRHAMACGRHKVSVRESLEAEKGIVKLAPSHVAQVLKDREDGLLLRHIEVVEQFCN